jgi:hypothetical protein
MAEYPEPVVHGPDRTVLEGKYGTTTEELLKVDIRSLYARHLPERLIRNCTG